MSDDDNNGGPAFPVSSYVNADGETCQSWLKGMTLRDWFAGQALPALAARTNTDFDQDASDAYFMADAMLAAREAK